MWKVNTVLVILILGVIPFSHGQSQRVDIEKRSLVTDTLTMDELLDVAVKFFDLRLTDDGSYGARLCTGFSIHSETQPTRDKHVELFCASAIMENSQGDDGLHQAFLDAVNEVAEMNLGIDKEDRLLRAQGALFMRMKLNPKLREALEIEYEKEKHWLHFYLSDQKLE